MLRFWFGGWRRSASFTPSEMKVLEALLPAEAPGATKLLKQAQEAPYVLREMVGQTGYAATIPYVEDASWIVDLEFDIESPVVELTDAKSGKRLGFSTRVSRGGFLFGLRGETCDGSHWPKNWCIGSEITCPPELATWLEPVRSVEQLDMGTLKELMTWSGARPERVHEQLDLLRLHPPATDEEIAECESRLKTALPRQYKDFVKICNGFRIRRGRAYEVLGTNDLDYLEDSWIGITPLYEDGYVAFRDCGDPYRCDCYLLAPHQAPVLIGDLRQHVRESLEWDCG